MTNKEETRYTEHMDTSSFMKHYFYRLHLHLVIIVLLVVGFGCSKSASIVSDVNRCGSNTAQGQYYDFQTHNCITPSKDKLPVYYYYAQLARIAAIDNSIRAAEITFATPIPTDRFASFIAALNVDAVISAYVLFPSVAGGLQGGVDLNGISSTPQEIFTGIQQRLTARYQEPQLPIQAEIKSELPAAFEHQNFQFLRLSLRAKPADLLEWWKKHPEAVRFIEALSSPIPWPHESEEFLR